MTDLMYVGDMPELTELPEIHWSDIKGYQFQVKPMPLMLIASGYTVNMKFGNRRKNQMHWCKVHFDAAYVAAYFANHYAAILAVPGESFRSQLCIALAPHLRGWKEYGE
jgi:hypothetical protein